MLHDTLANALTNIKTSEKLGKSHCTIEPASNLIKEVLQVMQKENYIGSFEYVDDGKAGKFKVKLIGRINDCGVIKPRYPVKVEELSEKGKRFLPAKDAGIILLSTSAGILTHKKAGEDKKAGVLLAYIY